MSLKKNILFVLLCLYMTAMVILPSKFKIIGIPFNGDVVFVVICLVYLLLLILDEQSRIKFIKNLKNFFMDRLSLLMIILLIIMLISVGYSLEKGLALKESMRFLSYLIIFFIIKYEIDSRNIISKLIRYHLFLCAVVCVYGIFQYFTQIGLDDRFIYDSRYSFSIRITSSLENPNNLGAFLVLALFPLIMIILYEKNKTKKTMYSLLNMLIMINIILTFSRNIWLGVFIGLLILILIYNWKLIVIFFAGGAVSLFIPKVINRLKDYKDVFNDPRIKLWKTALKMIEDHPIIGVGNGNYVSYYGSYITKYRELEYNHHLRFPVHNSYLKVYSELGIAGICCFAAILINIGLRLKNFVKNSNDLFYEAYFKGFFISFIVFLIINISDDFLFFPKTTVFFWIIVALFESIVYNNLLYSEN